MNKRIIRGASATALALALAASLTACGDDMDDHNMSGDSSAAGSEPGETQTASNGDVFNDADVQFASDMIQHHAQAVQMVVLTQDRTLDPEVQQIAEDIRAAQVPEIETMTDWLTAWDQEIPETSMDHANAGHDMSDMGDSMDMDMPGAMTVEDMDALANADDAGFQDMWLEMMIEHHTGAIEMAEAEQENGANDDAKALAATIVETQQAEISTMEGLLG